MEAHANYGPTGTVQTMLFPLKTDVLEQRFLSSGRSIQLIIVHFA